MKLNFFLCATFIFLLMSCNSNKVKHKIGSPSGVDSPAVEPGDSASLLELDGRLTGMDSLVVVFYNDPHGDDSLRYTRYYREFHTTDSGIISLVRTNLQEPTERFEKIKSCRSEGKIWCFSKGDIFQTLYFSSHNESCDFVYIIRNGQFYYSDIRKSLAQKLGDLKLLAIEPSNSGE